MSFKSKRFFIPVCGTRSGKTSLIENIVNLPGERSSSYIPTQGVRFSTKKFTRKCTIQFCDVSNTANIHSIHDSIFINSDGFLLCFNLDDKRSIEYVTGGFFDSILSFINRTSVIYLVGTHSDMVSTRVISQNDIDLAITRITRKISNYHGSMMMNTNNSRDDPLTMSGTKSDISQNIVKKGTSTFSVSNIRFLEVSNATNNGIKPLVDQLIADLTNSSRIKAKNEDMSNNLVQNHYDIDSLSDSDDDDDGDDNRKTGKNKPKCEII